MRNINRNINTNTNAAIASSSSSRVGPGGTSSGGSPPACAACKYQRRKCAPDCPLAPYFPPHRPQIFLNVHKAFGLHNVMNLLKTLHPSHHRTAMKALITEAVVRAKDPVGGCYRIICELNRLIKSTRAERDLALHQLNMYRPKPQDSSQHHMQNPNVVPQELDDRRRSSACAEPTPGQQPAYVDQDYNNNTSVFAGPRSCAIQGGPEHASPSMAVDGKQLLVDESEGMKRVLGIFDDKQPVSFEFKQSTESRQMSQNYKKCRYSLKDPTKKHTLERSNINSTNTNACAACKYQRRKCAPDCPLALYFPPNCPQIFFNVQKVFGLHHVMNILKTLHPSHHITAMKALITEAVVRAKDPVVGCYRIICELGRLIKRTRAERDLALRQLNHAQDASQHHNVDHSIVGNPPNPPESDGRRRSASAGPTSGQEPVYADQDCNNNTSVFAVPRSCAIQGGTEPSSTSMGVDGKQPIVDESEGIKRHLGIFEEKQPFPFEFKESTESRDKAELREDVDSIQQEQDHDLKGAASQFSLNSTNDKSI